MFHLLLITPFLHAGCTAVTSGLLAYACLSLLRLRADDRRKWWRTGSSLGTRWASVFLPLVALTCLIFSGYRPTSGALEAIGVITAGVAAYLNGSRIQRFLLLEASKRRKEMTHWLVRKPAEQRMAHQAMLRRKELDKVQARSLRKLMDPHFLFNALNGIVHDMLTKEWARALQNLSAFNRLAERQIKSGQRGWLTLNEEWEGLKDYLALEVRRLNRPIQWELEPIPEELQGLHIPSLMVQPLIENALWHGLGGTSETGGGHVRIRSEKWGAEHLRVSVHNSPGSARSFHEDLARPEDNKYHRRHASDLIQQRLNLLDRGGPSRYSRVSDAQGTTATLVLPCLESSWMNS